MIGLIMTCGDEALDPGLIERIAAATGISVRVSGVRDTEEAERIVDDMSPDVLIISIDQRTEFGLRLTRHVVARLSPIRIVWMSRSRENALTAYEEQVWHFLKLPMEEADLFQFRKRLDCA